MVGISVKEAAEILKQLDIKLIAGEKGIQRMITSISVLEMPNANLFWLKGGEFVLSTFFPFDTIADIIKIIETNHEGGSAALAIHLGSNNELLMDHSIIETGDKYDFPIFLVPPNVPYSIIFSKLYEKMFAGDDLRLSKAELFHNAAIKEFYLQALESSDQSEDELIKKGKELGIPQERYFTVIYLAVTYPLPEMEDQQKVKKGIVQLEKIVKLLLANYYPDVAIFPQEFGIAVILQINATDYATEEKELLKSIAQAAQVKINKNNNSFDLYIGIGRPKKGFIELKKSFEEAKNTADIGQKLGYSNQTLFYTDMGVYSLFDLNMLEKLKANCFSEFKALTSLLGKKHEVLLETLEVFYDNNESIITTANAMFMHVNTVKYRIDKLKELLGESYFGNGPNKLKCYLVLKICKTL